MQNAGVPFEKIFAEENPELARRYSIMQAPTLLKVGADGKADVVRGAAAVFQEIPSLKVHA